MMQREHMTPNQVARTAGALYLIVVLTGTFVLGYFPSQLAMPGDPAMVAKHLSAHEALLRFAIAAGVVCYVAFLLLPLVLYKLLSPFGKNLAVLMVAFAVVSAPLSFANLRHLLDMLSMLNGAVSGLALSAERVGREILLSHTAYRNGLLLCKVFWGLWLLPFGILVFRSGVFPKLLGLLLMVGCIGYVIDFFGRVLVAGYAETMLAEYATRPAALGEVGICLWLLVLGVRERQTSAALLR